LVNITDPCQNVLLALLYILNENRQLMVNYRVVNFKTDNYSFPLGIILGCNCSWQSQILARSYQDLDSLQWHLCYGYFGKISSISARCIKSCHNLTEIWKTSKHNGKISAFKSEINYQIRVELHYIVFLVIIITFSNSKLFIYWQLRQRSKINLLTLHKRKRESPHFL